MNANLIIDFFRIETYQYKKISAYLLVLASVMLHGLYVTLCGILVILGLLIIFYGTRKFVKHSLDALLLVIISTIGLSFLPPSQQSIATVILLLFFLYVLFAERDGLKKTLQSDIENIAELEGTDKFAWLGTLLCVLLLGCFFDNGFWALDIKHPIYELSCGFSFNNNFLDVPDLSYSGKVLRYHFLSTKIPFYFANIFHINLLNSAYFLTPLFLMFITIISLHSFFYEFPEIKQPVLWLLFIPITGNPLFHKAFLATTSYSLAFILMIFALRYLVKRAYWRLIFTAILLLLTKASFFITLYGGIFLFFLRNKEYKNIYSYSLLLGIMFLSLYFLFLSGAHQHNLWLFLPTYISNVLYFNVGIIKGLCLPIAMTVIIVASFMKYRENDILLAITSLALSGVLGTWLLSEMTEGNASQFLSASSFSIALIVLYWITNSQFFKKNIVKFAFYLILGLGLVTSVKPYSHYFGFINNNLIKGNRTVLYDDLIEAYSWMESNVKSDGVVLFSKHYENYSKNNFWPKTHFVRSALSGKQLFFEDYKYKGIVMAPDFSERFANIIHFYENFVILSQESKERIQVFHAKNFGKQPGVSASEAAQNGGLKDKLAYYLSGGKEWSWQNTSSQVMYETSNKLKVLEVVRDDPKWADEFLKSANIRYIVLEEKDLPNNWLQTITATIFKNASIRILEIKQAQIYIPSTI